MLSMGRGTNSNKHPLLVLTSSKDKAMMERWGLSGMRSFEQQSVKQKEADRLGVAWQEAQNETQPSL